MYVYMTVIMGEKDNACQMSLEKQGIWRLGEVYLHKDAEDKEDEGRKAGPERPAPRGTRTQSGKLEGG